MILCYCVIFFVIEVNKPKAKKKLNFVWFFLEYPMNELLALHRYIWIAFPLKSFLIGLVSIRQMIFISLKKSETV